MSDVSPNSVSIENARGPDEPISIDTVGTKLVSTNVADKIAIANQELKQFVANKIITSLTWSLGITWLLTFALAIIDTFFVLNNVIDPTERLITENVVMAVIGATVVQVGAASIAIVYSLFGRPKGDEGE